MGITSLKKWNLNKKILVSLILVTAVGIVACYLTFTKMIRRRTLEQLCETKVDLLKNISDKESYIMENILNISNTFLIDADIQRYLKMNKNESQYNKLQQEQKIKEKISDKRSVFLNIKYDISLADLEGDNYFSSSEIYTKKMNKTRMQNCQKLLSDIGYQLVWTNAVKHDEKYIITAASYIQDIQNGKPIGVVLFDFSEEVFGKIYQDYTKDQESFLLMNERGEVISSSVREIVGRNYSKSKLWEEINNYEEGYFYDKETKNLIMFVRNKTVKSYIIGTMSYKKMMEPYKNFLGSLPWMVVFIFGVCFVMAQQISKLISKPVQKLAREIHMYRIKKDNPEFDIERKDEISYLEQEYHFMIQRLEDMIQQIYEEQERKRRYEIEALKGQIHPHFLYNTLISIRYLNMTEKKDEVDHALLALSNILAVYFKDKSSYQSVEKEMEFLKNYCYIQQVRYGNNFDTLIKYEEETSEIYIPKMILQPIVENAVFHGFSSYEEGGCINIIARKEGEKLIISVKDNGIGFQMRGKLEKTESHGIGVENVRERLKLIYGDAASMQIESAEGIGTKVMFVFPIDWGDEIE